MEWKVAHTKNKKVTNPNLCWYCQKEKITFYAMPCRCEILCLKCAKKVSTGGYCKKCHEMICQCQRIIK
jgi:hypothetical protein